MPHHQPVLSERLAWSIGLQIEALFNLAPVSSGDRDVRPIFQNNKPVARDMLDKSSVDEIGSMSSGEKRFGCPFFKIFHGISIEFFGPV